MRKLLALTTIVALPLIAGCTVHQDAAPSAASGPAEAGLSLKILASPDRLLQDGLQSSRIAVTAFDAAGQPIAANVRLAVSPFNFGTLSAATITTRADLANPVFVTYIPPAASTGSTVDGHDFRSDDRSQLGRGELAAGVARRDADYSNLGGGAHRVDVHLPGNRTGQPRGAVRCLKQLRWTNRCRRVLEHERVDGIPLEFRG